MWILGILFALIYGVAEIIKDSYDAKRYHQSDEYKRYKELSDKLFKE